MKRFEPAACLYRDATDVSGQRLAIRYWLTEAIRSAMESGEEVAAALALLTALENLDFGQVDPLLRISPARAPGGTEPPPSVSGAKAMALAAIDSLVNQGRSVQFALAMVEDSLPEFSGKLSNLRKKVLAERGVKAEFRKKYRTLISEYDLQMAAFEGWSAEEIFFGLERVNCTFGGK